MLGGEVSWFAVSGDGARLVIGDRGDVRVVPSDRKADNGPECEAGRDRLHPDQPRAAARPPLIRRRARRMIFGTKTGRISRGS